MGTGAVESVGGLLSSTLVQGAGVLSQVLFTKNCIAWNCLKLSEKVFFS